jgi:GDP-mannose transporter
MFAIGGAIISYSLCSSTLLLANKLALEYLPLPSVISFLQIIAAVAIVLCLKTVCKIPVDDLEGSKLKAYSMYIVAFVSAIYANMQALKHSNVETVIVFRACSPIAVSIIEYLFMDRALPTIRSFISLSVVGASAILYCYSDSQFKLNGIGAYSWVSIYFVLITFEMTYGKLLTSSVKMNSVWGPVFYCNLLAALPMFLLGYSTGDYDNITMKLISLPNAAILIIVFSCITGTLIGYTGWMCRGMISATSYTLVGVVNKFLTVLLNVVIWDKHSSPIGLLAVCCCLFAGMFYQQAPRREEGTTPNTKVVDQALRKENRV